MYIEKWYEKSWVIILFLIFLFPVGLIMMWINKYEWEDRTKKEISIFGGIAFLFIIFTITGNINAPKKEVQVTKAPEQVITQTKDNKLKIYYFNSLSSTGVVGDTIKFSDSINEVGNVEYQLSYEKDSNVVIVQPFSNNNNKFEWIASEPGNYIFTLTIKNSNDEVKSDKLYIKIISKEDFNNQVASKATITKSDTESKQINNENKSNETTKENIVPTEYKSALTKAEQYSKIMYISKQGIYDQLTSESGEKFSVAAAQYAVDNLKADYKQNALKKAQEYQQIMSMSPNAIYDQLTSASGEKFTAEEAKYAIDNLK